MPSKKRASSVTANDQYESDSGFVEDAPRSKKAKTVKKAAPRQAEVRDVGESKVDDEGQVFWELSGKRRIGVQEFKGNTMINIREYYEKDGQMLPGKKGISLPIDQFNAVLNILPDLEKVLTQKGATIVRPKYDAVDPVNPEAEEKETGEPDVKVKKNFEETSDED